MLDLDDPSAPMTPGERVFMLIVAAFFLGLFVAELASNYHPAKLSALFFILWWGPLIALHEFGHTLVAKLVGWRIGRIVVGVGKTVGRWRIGQSPLEVRAFPVGGFMTCLPRSAKGGNWKEFLIYFGGPGIELVLVAAIAIFFRASGLSIMDATHSVPLIALQALALAATVGAVINLFPIASRNGSREVPNDGLGMLLALGRDRSHYEMMTGADFEDSEDE